MESDFGRKDADGSADAYSSAAASEALKELNADGARLADRVVTPWWYHGVLGVIVAAFVGSQVLDGAAPLFVVALGIVALPVLTTAYSRRYGVTVTRPAGRRSRRLLFGTVAVLVVAMIAAIVLTFIDVSPWWVLVPTTAAFIATVVFGRRYDDALRGELTRNGDARL